MTLDRWQGSPDNRRMNKKDPSDLWNYLATDDPQWKEKATKLAKKQCPFDVNDLNCKGDTTFVIELAREHAYPLTIQFDKKSLGRAEFRPA